MEKVQISQRALLGRISRDLSKMGVVIKKNRPDSTLRDSLGEYYLVDRKQGVVKRHVDLEEYARGTGCLKPYEGIAA